ncbi:MAG TPA: hypothetical protein VJH65_01495 [Candidatus Nanoarchaeia archaeon]|nr:hypothetical protein [Candidatus Nanoarchaeia archaeon]
MKFSLKNSKKNLARIIVPALISGVAAFGCGQRREDTTFEKQTSTKQTEQTQNYPQTPTQDVFTELPGDNTSNNTNNNYEDDNQSDNYTNPTTNITNIYPESSTGTLDNYPNQNTDTNFQDNQDNPNNIVIETNDPSSQYYSYHKINDEGTIALSCGYLDIECPYEESSFDQRLENLTDVYNNMASTFCLESLFKPINVHSGLDSLCAYEGYSGYVGFSGDDLFVCLFVGESVVDYHELMHVFLKGRSTYAKGVEENELYSVSRVLSGEDESFCGRNYFLGQLCRSYGYELEDYTSFVKNLDAEYQENGEAGFQKRKDIFADSVYQAAQRLNPEITLDEINQDVTNYYLENGLSVEY